MAQEVAICWWPAIKSMGEGRLYCIGISAKFDFELSVPNNLHIDCVDASFAHLLNLV